MNILVAVGVGIALAFGCKSQPSDEGTACACDPQPRFPPRKVDDFLRDVDKKTDAIIDEWIASDERLIKAYRRAKADEAKYIKPLQDDIKELQELKKRYKYCDANPELCYLEWELKRLRQESPQDPEIPILQKRLDVLVAEQRIAPPPREVKSK